MKNEFYDHYKERVVPALQKQHGYKNPHQVPKVEKVVVNTSVGSQQDVKQALEDAKAELALITGQKPSETRAKKSIANFKLRKEQAIGAKVTLRGEHMYEFLERLIKAALPRIRDFRGVSPKAFDGHGNYTLGVSDQSIFPCGLSCDFFKCFLISRTPSISTRCFFASTSSTFPDDPAKLPVITSTLSPFRTWSLIRFIKLPERARRSS